MTKAIIDESESSCVRQNDSLLQQGECVAGALMRVQREAFTQAMFRLAI
jgi:hypothetical protein